MDDIPFEPVQARFGQIMGHLDLLIKQVMPREMHWVVPQDLGMGPVNQLMTYSVTLQNHNMHLDVKVMSQDIRLLEATVCATCSLLESTLFSLVILKGNGLNERYQWYPRRFWDPRQAPKLSWPGWNIAIFLYRENPITLVRWEAKFLTAYCNNENWTSNHASHAT